MSQAVNTLKGFGDSVRIIIEKVIGGNIEFFYRFITVYKT